MHVVNEDWRESSSYYSNSALAYVAAGSSNNRMPAASQVDGRYSVPSMSSSTGQLHQQQQQRPISVDVRSDTSSESDAPVPSPSPREEKKKEGREKSKSSVLGLFRKGKKGKGPHV